MGDHVTLAVDLGSTFGYCVGRNGVIIESGEVTLSAGVGKTHPGHRWLRFQNWLSRFGDVNEILFEDVQFVTSAMQMRVYGGLLAVLQIFSLAHGIRMGSYSPQTIKKGFTGFGNAKKIDMCEVAINLGWKNGVAGTENNHNECDAIALFWVATVKREMEPSFKPSVNNGETFTVDEDEQPSVP